MKIHSLTGAIGYSTRIREKSDGQTPENAFQDSKEQREEEQRQKEHQKEQLTLPVSLAQVTEAAAAFQEDEQAKLNGLNASVSSTAPGLKVVLKNESGDVVRQLTGEEFLKLRESSAGFTKVQGKILDQKL
jgi:uncharacterized FlaG/YvyC family protein